MYEANQHDDDLTGENIVRSQFGSPPNSRNGSRSSTEPRNGSAEGYRFDPTRPRRRRYAAADDETTQTPRDTDPETGSWTVKRPGRLGRDTARTDNDGGRRPTRAERRRAESADSEDYATTRSADLSRIASFLRSTQEHADDAEDEPATEEISLPARGRHHADDAEDKTSELPTVPAEPPPPAESSDAQPSDRDKALAAVRQVPGVTGARLTDSDSRLALDIADNADTDAVHRKVIEVLDSHLGLRAAPVSPAVKTVENDARDRGVPLPAGGRVVLERIQVITSGFESTVEVGLAVAGGRAVGRATGPAVDWHTLRGSAEATVDAIGVLLGNQARVVVEYANVEPAGSVPVAVVMVLLLTRDGAEQLAGASPVLGDRRQAVVHATLQALNRRLETLLGS